MHRRASVAIAAVAVLGLGGAVAQQAAATPATSHAGSSLASASLSKAESAQDGRALFEGLAFAQGSVAKELADSGKFMDVAALRKENSTAEQRQAASALLDKIQQERPEFFSSFSQQLRSGDPRKVVNRPGSNGDSIS